MKFNLITSKFKQRARTRIYIVPPAQPGNLGDMVCLGSAMKLCEGSAPHVLDLFGDTDKSMKNWQDYSDLRVHTLADLALQSNGLNLVHLIFIGQDSIDSRYGDFHLQKLKQSIEILENQNIACRLAIWNITVSESFPLSETALWLLERSESVVFRDNATDVALKNSAIQIGLQNFDLSSVYLLGINREIDFETRNSGKIGLSVGREILKHQQEIFEMYQDLELAIPNVLLNLDSREYPFVESDRISGLSVGKTIGAKLHELEAHEHTDFYHELDSKLSQLSNLSSVQTSRYHVTISALILGRKVELFAHNEKFEVLTRHWKNSLTIKLKTISYFSIEPILNRSSFLEETAQSWRKETLRFLSK